MSDAGVIDHPVDAQQVERFLRDHPDFFISRDSLLQKMQIPHAPDGAASLLSRQNALLRKEHQQFGQRLKQLLQVAEQNEQLFHALRQCVLSLLQSEDLQALCHQLKLQVCTLFSTDMVRVFLFEQDCQPHNSWLSVDQGLLKAYLPNLLKSHACVCGEFDRDLRLFLFADPAIASAAIAPLLDAQQQAVGLLALGSVDKNYFSQEMDTLFLHYLAQVFAIELNKRIS